MWWVCIVSWYVDDALTAPGPLKCISLAVEHFSTPYLLEATPHRPRSNIDIVPAEVALSHEHTFEQTTADTMQVL